MNATETPTPKQVGTVDWLTCTSTDREAGWFWYNVFDEYQKRFAEEYNVPPVIKDRTQRGYQGREGEGMFWGVSERQGYLFVCWGEAADMVWPMSAPAAKRISRIDLAVTVELPKLDPNLARRAYSKNRGKTRPEYTMLENSKDGRTLYIGSRKSDQYGRLYDKGVKDLGREPGSVWRYEIELKEKLKNMALMQSIYDRWRLHGLAREDITSYVHQWFNVRGVSPKFSARGKGMPKPELEATVSTANKKLRWLSQQVAPTVQKLIDLGLGDEALLALGLEREQLPMWDVGSIRSNGYRNVSK